MEYRAVANVVAAVSWLCQLLLELHMPLSTVTSARSTCLPTPFSISPKHIEFDLHFVRERVALGDTKVLHTPTTSQFVDIFTKEFPGSVFDEFRSNLNVNSAAASVVGVC